MKEIISDAIDKTIKDAILYYDGDVSCSCSFSKLLSFGELVDRLSIVNFKLFTLKNKVILESDNVEFKAWAATEDVKLVEERSRLKKCIDEKLIHIINRLSDDDASGGFNPEVKNYG